ncbi:MAG: type II secretion system F family protein [Robiginitomaculum sp.]|nr:type II secretion system F family protein [Robiginitomaculum sp.]MDQ7077613.1 type II secretion system F family protein [Robiginitomaculum sp.]
MPKFQYKAIRKNGSTVSGEIEAADQDAAYLAIEKRQLSPFSLVERKDSPLMNFLRARKVTRKDQSAFIRQLATLLKAGVGLLEAMKSLAKSNANPALAKCADAIRSDLRAGQRLSESLETHMQDLPRYVPRLAELGEATGTLAKALADASERMEFEDSMRSEIRGALSYPLFLASVGGLIVILMFLFVVPRFDALIGNHRDNLPAISKVVIATGVWMKGHIPLFLAIAGVFTASVIFMVRNKAVREWFRSTAEKTPVIGSFLIQSEIGGWARTMGIALDNGADILTALRLGASGLQSRELKNGMEGARSEIRAGRNIDEVLEEHLPAMDALSIDLIRTGRNSGALADMLLFVADTKEKETRERAKGLTAIAEPAAILFIAMIVGTIVLSIVLAMTSLYDFDI